MYNVIVQSTLPLYPDYSKAKKKKKKKNQKGQSAKQIKNSMIIKDETMG